MKHKKTWIGIASAIFLSAAPFAGAVPTIYIDYGDDGVIDATIIDQLPGDLVTGIPGMGVVSTFFGPGGAGGLMGTVTATTKPAVGSATKPNLSQVSLEIAGTGTLAIYFTEDLYGPTGPGYHAELTISTGAPATAVVDSYSYATIAAFAPFVGAGTPMISLGASSLDALSGNGTLAFDGSVPPPFTLTQKVIITKGGAGGTVLVTANLTSVPDGGTTMALFGVSLLGLYGARRKFSK